MKKSGASRADLERWKGEQAESQGMAGAWGTAGTGLANFAGSLGSIKW